VTLATLRYEAERRLRGSLLLAVGFSLFAAMIILIAPAILEEVDLAALLEQYPPALVERLGLDKIGTMAGFLALELYQFVWLLAFGGYVAYSAAGSIAGEVETRRIERLLSAPISRARLLVETYLALLVPIAIVNAVVLVVVYGGAIGVGEPLPLRDLLAVHLLSIPYLLCVGAFGMLASVAVGGRTRAEGVAVGGVIGTFLLESLVMGTEVEWVGAISPGRYYDPLAVLTDGGYDLPGAAILLGATLALLGLATLVFGQVDL
jgi:ABC-2 type transport system permease protein